MDKNAVKPTEIMIKRKKHTVKGDRVRAAVLGRFKVIELATADNVPFYVIFYKDSLIYGDQVEAVQEGSFIREAFQDGIVFEAPHPVLELMAPHPSLSIPNPNKLFADLTKHHSDLELAYITATLDSFFEKDQLSEMIHERYGHLKRDGKHFKAFQIIRKLKEFAPEASSVQHQFMSPEFHAFQEMYNHFESIHEKDPLYYEQYAFKNRSNPKVHSLLKNELEEQNRSLDALLLWLETAESQATTESTRKYTDMALQLTSMDRWILILSKARVNPFQELPKAKSFIEAEIKKGNDKEAVAALLPFMNDLPDSFEPVLKSLWDGLDPKFMAHHLDELLPALKQMATTDNEKPFNRTLFQLTAYLLKENELDAVQKKLDPVKKIFPHAATIRKIDQMSASSQDPDCMMQLGKDYAEFEQYDQAIECFSMEMEFHPEEPAPVWHLSKMYQQKGMVKEAEAYQQFFTELKKNG